MSAVYAVWRRELVIMVRAPILYVVGGLFLVVQGIAFAGLVTALSDPRRPAPLGALLEGQLGGTLLTWVLELVVLTLLGMRTIAEDKRGGGWELLLTAQVGEGAAVVGKWLAAITVYAMIWIPTLAYLVVVALFRADDGGWDLAAIACGYLGAVAIGAALLAWAIAASAATASTLAAGAFGFALLIGWFLVGELPALWPDLTTDHPAIAAALAAVSLRATATGFARGELAGPALVLVAGLAVTGLSLAITLATLGRRRRAEVRIRGAATIAIAAVSMLVGILAVRHPLHWDVSSARRNSLDPETLRVLGALPGATTLTIVEPTLGALEPIYDEVARVADRIAAASPAVEVRRVDPANAPGGLDAVAHAAGLQPGDLASGGAVVVRVGGREQVIDLLAFATFDKQQGGPPVIERFAIEQTIAGALAALSTISPVTVCATEGHGELPLTVAGDHGADWGLVAKRLAADGMTLDDVAIASGVPARCKVVVVIGPASPLTADEALAAQAFLAGGGGLLVAAASRTVAGGLASTGLEGVLGAEGLALPSAIAIDPALAVRELPGALLVVAGYAEHPINAGFARTRATMWFQPRVILATSGAHPLISATAASWGERDLEHAPPVKDADDLAGPVALAAAGSKHRVIAIGSAESLTSAVLAGGASAGDLWIAHAVQWLADVQPAWDARWGAGWDAGWDAGRPAAPRPPDQIRLVMTASERRAVIALCVGGIPLVWALAGGLLVWWRRTR